ncbi:MAG: exo-alpha-sialidase [Clostridia bacterium]|nr:exo-alpha-sialidase [Clostridia bacterium]
MSITLRHTDPVNVYGPSEGCDVRLTYPRLVELSHSGEHNGTLIATGETLEVSGYKVFESKDGGASWSHISTIEEQLQEGFISNWQPHIYELPCRIGDMPEGTILVAGCSRDPQVAIATKMCLWRSYDIGRTWEEFTVVDEGGRIDHGMYEPFVMCDDDGTLVCFYSDETEVDDVHGQRLVFRCSKDGINWGEKKYLLAPEDKHLRPGMVTVSKTNDGKYVASYEMVRMPESPVHVKISDSLTDWGDPNDYGVMVKSTDGKILGSTPCCAWLPHGEDGIIFVAGWRNVANTSKTGADLFYSADMGKTWVAAENPLPYVWSNHHRFSYSPCLLTSNDQSCVYYMSDVNWEGNTEEYIRGKYVFTKISVE